MSGLLLFLAPFVGLPLLLIFLAKRDRSHTKMWGDLLPQNSVMGGAEFEMPRILPVEPVAGPLINGAPVDDLSHNFTLDKTGANAPDQ